MDSQFKLTPRAKKALAVANNIAANSGHSYVGAEHLFLALLSEDQSGVQRIVEGCGLSPNDFRGKVSDMFKACCTTAEQPKPDLREIAQTLRKLADSLC